MSTPAEGTPAAAATAAAGVVVGGRYRLVRRIAGGGMGDVWRAADVVLDRPVAIKLLKAEYLEEPAFLERFRSEARLAGMLHHPGIAAVHDYGEHGGPGGSSWLVMELVEGEPLSRLLHRRGPLPPEQSLNVVGQAGLALQAAHDAGVVHRDVKPGNLLVQPDGIVKITDFGIARATGAAPLTRTGTVLGTAHYLSPEQARGQPASPASDVYALGIVGYECLAGHRPFEGDSPVEVALAHQRDEAPKLPAGLPAPVVSLIERALAKDPAQRTSSAGAMGRTALGIRAALYLGEPSPLLAPSAGLAAAVDVPAALADPPAPSDPGATQAVGTPEAVGPDGTRLLPAASPAGARRHPPPWARRLAGRRLPTLVLGLLVMAILLAALVRSCSSAGPHRPARVTTRPTTRASTPAPIALDLAAYRGLPADQVIAALRALGLQPSRVDVVSGGSAGTVVTIVLPDGGPLPATLPRGSAVVVQAVAAPVNPPGPPGGGHGDNGNGKGHD